MTASLDEDGKVWLLLGQLLYKPTFIPQSFSYLHPNLTFRLLFGIKLAIIQDELLVLEEYRDSQTRNWLPVVSEEFLQHRISIHEIELLRFLAQSASKQEAKLKRHLSLCNLNSGV